MKFNYILSTFLVFLCTSISAHAESTKVEPSVVQKAPQQAIQKKEDPNLKRFNDAVNVKYLGYQHNKDEKGNSIIDFVYRIENKSNRNIRSVHWATSYLYDQEVILAHDLPVSFSKPLMRNTATEIAFSIPLENLPSRARDIFSQTSPKIMMVNQAKSIVFSNGAKITVK